MSNSPDTNVVKIGGGGKLYADARAADARELLDEHRLNALLSPEPPPWADVPEEPEPPKEPSVVVPKNLPEPVKEPRVDVKEFFSTCLELAGITALSVAGWMVTPALGLAVIGIALVLLGVATSRAMRG